MADEEIAPNTYTADPVGRDRKSCLNTVLEYTVVCWRDFLPILTKSAVLYLYWDNSLVFHFAGSSMYSSFIYGAARDYLVT